MVAAVWDMMEQEDAEDRDVDLAGFNPGTPHGFVVFLDFSVEEHAHGEEYDFITELSKSAGFEEEPAKAATVTEVDI